MHPKIRRWSQREGHITSKPHDFFLSFWSSHITKSSLQICTSPISPILSRYFPDRDWSLLPHENALGSAKRRLISLLPACSKLSSRSFPRRDSAPSLIFPGQNLMCHLAITISSFCFPFPKHAHLWTPQSTILFDLIDSPCGISIISFLSIAIFFLVSSKLPKQGVSTPSSLCSTWRHRSQPSRPLRGLPRVQARRAVTLPNSPKTYR